MGAGFFPLTLSAVGGILGGVVLVKAIVAPRPTDETVDIRRFLLVCAAFVVFAVSIEPGGLVLAIVATTVVGSLAHRDSKFLESLAFGVLLAVFVWLVFIQLLGLPIHAWPDLN
jgi:phosphate/sulfate permease